jgi:type II secretory pathway component PulF
MSLAIDCNEFLVTYSLEASLFILMLLALGYWYRNLFLTFCLELPLVKKLHSMVLEIRFCKLLGLLLDKGISLTKAVDVATSTISGQKRIRQLKHFNLALHRGEAIGLAVGMATEVFSPITAELIAIGAETGYLPKLLHEAASILEQDLQERLEKLREVLSPILLLLAALITALVVCSVIGPLFDLFSALPEYH